MATRSQIVAQINSLINDNTSGDITPADVRAVLNNINTSAVNFPDDSLSGKYSINNLVTVADVLTAIGDAELLPNSFYRITDADSNTRVLLVQAESTTVLFAYAIDVDSAEVGIYDVNTDTFTAVGGGAGIYTKDANDNVFFDGVTATLGSNCEQNIFHQGATGNTLGANSINNIFEQNAVNNELGDDSFNNTFKQVANGFTFRTNLQNVTIEAGVTGDVYTSLPDYAFLYNNDYPATIFYDGTDNFHCYYDVANDRIVLTNLRNLAVSYIGGAGGGGISSIQEGTNISVDNSTPSSPIINSLADRYKTTSVTSNTISNGSKTFAVDANLSYVSQQEILVVFNASNHMHGTVTSYSGTTLVVDIKNHTGSGTYTSWSINLDGTPVDALTGSGTANEIAYFTAAGILASLNTTTYPSLTELSYVKGVTSAIQTQIDTKLASAVSFNRQTASYTLVIGDAYKTVEMNVGSANNLTIPSNSSVAFATGTIINVSQYGLGQTTIVGASGVTLRSVGGWVKLAAQYAVVSLVKVGTDEWYVFGGLTA